MIAREKLREYYISKGMGEPDGWFAILLFGRRWRLFPMGPLQPLLTLHDLHHLLTGTDSSLGGEAEVIAWEIGSGGYGKFWFAWMDSLKIVALALLYPRRFQAALRRGQQCRNLYREDVEEVLSLEWNTLRAKVGLSEETETGEVP